MPVTLLQLLGLIGAAATAIKDIADLVRDIKAEGHPDDAPLKPDHQLRLTAIIDRVNTATGNSTDLRATLAR